MATDTTLTGTATPGRNPQYEKARVRETLTASAFKSLPVRRHEISGNRKERTVTMFTVKPTAFTEDLRTRLAQALSKALDKEVTLKVVPEAVAVAKNVRRTPLKVRHVLQLVRGKNVQQAMDLLSLTPNFAAADILKVVRSAAANANQGWGADPHELEIVECYADRGAVMKRFRPGPMGRARPILKPLSHITVVLANEMEAEGA